MAKKVTGLIIGSAVDHQELTTGFSCSQNLHSRLQRCDPRSVGPEF